MHSNRIYLYTYICRKISYSTVKLCEYPYIYVFVYFIYIDLLNKICRMYSKMIGWILTMYILLAFSIQPDKTILQIYPFLAFFFTSMLIKNNNNKNVIKDAVRFFVFWATFLRSSVVDVPFTRLIRNLDGFPGI